MRSDGTGTYLTTRADNADTLVEAVPLKVNCATFILVLTA